MRRLFPDGFRQSTFYWLFVGYGCITWPVVLVVAGSALLVASPWLSSGWAWALAVVAAVALGIVVFFALLLVAAARSRRAWREWFYPTAPGAEPEDATHPATQQPAQIQPPQDHPTGRPE